MPGAVDHSTVVGQLNKKKKKANKIKTGKEKLAGDRSSIEKKSKNPLPGMRTSASLI